MTVLYSAGLERSPAAKGRPLSRDGRPEPGLRKKAANLASVIALIALVVGSLFGDRGVLQLIERREKVEALSREIEDLRAENARLAADIVALRTDPFAIERVAREELGFARAGETVFLVRDDPPTR
jgi:cell division protein FtsB